MSKRKHITLFISGNDEILDTLKSGAREKKQLAARYSVDTSTISDIKKNRWKTRK